MNHIRKFIDAGGYLSVSSVCFIVSTSTDDNITRLPLVYLFAKEGEPEYEILEYYLNIIINLNKNKSTQEVAAEEAVQKAESALKAAKEVLAKVKEK